MSRQGPVRASPEAPREAMRPGARGGGTAVSSRRLMELYVALKSKPVAILVGPAGSGKLAAARALGARLAAADGMCFQEMMGHPWWASRSAGVALFTEAQQRFNHEKVQALLEESAAEPSGERVRVALLSRISPAEWSDLAALTTLTAPEGARQVLQAGRKRPVALRGILLIATADAAAPAPWDPELLRTVSILPWGEHDEIESQEEPTWPSEEVAAFEREVVRAPRSALGRLRRLNGWRDERLKPLLAIAQVMTARGIPEANCAASEALVYLANAWTSRGEVLLAASFEENLRWALRLAVVLAFLPRLEGRPDLPGEVLADIETILDERAGMVWGSAGRDGLRPLARAWPGLPALNHTSTATSSVQERR